MRARSPILAGAAILSMAAISLGPLPARAEAGPTSEEIVQSLAPKVTERRVRSFRGITVEKTKEKADPAKHNVNLYVTFAFNSADLTTDARILLRSLGEALIDQRLTEYKFEIAGHTDAKGTDDYNQALSERRAMAVRDFLAQYYRVAPDRMRTVGYGESRLLIASDPEAAANRRVQISNIGEIAPDPSPAPPPEYMRRE